MRLSLGGVRKGPKEADMKKGRETGRAARWIIVSGLAGLLLVAQMAQADGRKAGVKVDVVTRQGGELIKGEVIGVRSDAVILETADGAGRTIATKDIASILVRRKSAALVGIVLGAAAGGGLGYVSAYGPNSHKFLGGITIAAYTGVGILVGGLAGGIFGAAASADKTYDLTRLPAQEIDKLMAYLRKRARVPDYK
jgi:hypothetical protein